MASDITIGSHYSRVQDNTFCTHCEERMIGYLKDPVLSECVSYLITLDDYILAQDLDGIEVVAALLGVLRVK